MSSLEEIVRAGVGEDGTQSFSTSDINKAYQDAFGSPISSEDMARAVELRSTYRAGSTVAPTSTPEATTAPVPTSTAPKVEPDTLSHLSPQERAEYDKTIAGIDAQKAKYETFIADMNRDIEEELKAVTENIERVFAKRIQRMEEANTGIVANVGTSGMRTGLARYAPEMYEGNIGRALDEGADRISSLEASKAQAIREAKNAVYSDADDKWARFHTQMSAIQKFQDDKLKTLLSMNDLARQLEDRAILNAKTQMGIQQDMIENLKSLSESGATLSPEDRQKYAEALNVSVDFIDEFIDIQQGLFKELSASESIKKMTQIVDLLNKVPEGQEIPLMNAKGELEIFTGWKEGTTRTYMQHNRATNTTSFITVNSKGEIVNSESIGGVGSPFAGARGGTGGGSGTSSSVGTFEQWLKAKEESEQFSYNIDNAQVVNMLRSQYEAIAKKQKATPTYATEPIKLTSTQYNNGLNNFMKETGGTRQEFDRLPPTDQVSWSRGTTTKPTAGFADGTSSGGGSQQDGLKYTLPQ